MVQLSYRQVFPKETVNGERETSHGRFRRKSAMALDLDRVAFVARVRRIAGDGTQKS